MAAAADTRQIWHNCCINFNRKSALLVLIGKQYLGFPARVTCVRLKESVMGMARNCGVAPDLARSAWLTIACSRMPSREVQMDVNFTSLPSLQPQSGGQSGNSQATGSATTAVKTLQTNPDSVVRQSSQTAGSQNDSGRGLAREEPRELKSAQQALDSLRFSSRKTQVGFDNELNRVFIEVVDTRTDQVVEQIPSEEFVRFVHEQLEPPARRASEESNGAVVDEAV